LRRIRYNRWITHCLEIADVCRSFHCFKMRSEIINVIQSTERFADCFPKLAVPICFLFFRQLLRLSTLSTKFCRWTRIDVLQIVPEVIFSLLSNLRYFLRGTGYKNGESWRKTNLRICWSRLCSLYLLYTKNLVNENCSSLLIWPNVRPNLRRNSTPMSTLRILIG